MKKSKNFEYRESGFTLIEVIVVIVLLSIIAVTAAPRFINLSGDANASVIMATSGIFSSSARMWHMKARIDGALGNGFYYRDVWFDQGYPMAVDANWLESDGIPEIIETLDIDIDKFTYNRRWFGSASTGEETRELYVTLRSILQDGATWNQISETNCYFTYETFVSTPKEPKVEVFTSGC